MSTLIKTLDGKEWEEKELLKLMLDDSFYYGYLGKHCLSSSAIKQMIKQGTWEYIPVEENQSLRDGRLIHLLTLEPHRVKELTFVGGTKASKNYKALSKIDAISRELYTLGEYNKCKRIADAVVSDLEAFDILHGSKMEVPAIKMLSDLPVRGKADILRPERFIGDLKTTRNLEDTDGIIEYWGYDVQGALYRDLFDVDDFVIVWVSKSTLEVKVQWLTNEQLNIGQEKYLKALEQYKWEIL